jgi:hypothetical protein
MVERLMKTLNGKAPTFHPSCFYLSWTDEAHGLPQAGRIPKYRATWCDYRDIDREKNKFAATVKWKDLNMDLVIATDYVGEPYSITIGTTYRNREYLKSHLQKVIRRSNPYKALLTAWHFIDLDLHDFLRRLCIIAMEDCLPLDGYSTIVWFTAAVSKGYKPSDVQIAWILGYVHDLSLCKHYEQISSEPNLSLREIKMRSLEQDGKNLVYSIILRKSYGGMRGDKDMCSTAAKLWSARYNTNSCFLTMLKRKDIFISPPETEMRKSEWVIGAIDFHCCPNIIVSVWEKHDEFTELEIKDAIWHCSSSVTDKVNIAEDFKQRNPTGRHLEVWRVIRKDFLSYAKFMLDRNG